MNILLDFIPFQYAGGIGGAASFTYRITEEVIKNKNKQKLFAIYDSKLPEGQLYSYKNIAIENKIELVDRSSHDIGDIITKLKIDIWFIAIAQFYAECKLKNISCKTIMFIHDIFDIERNDNRIDLMITDPHYMAKTTCIKRFANIFIGRWKKRSKKWYKNIMPLYLSPNTIAYTVSYYTRDSLRYYFNNLRNKTIRVCYSPLKEVTINLNIENKYLHDIIETKKNYILLLAADREYKNARILLKVFPKIKQEFPHLYLLTLNYGKSIDKQHIDINFLSDSDLEYAYKYAKVLVFPSFFEGFGYPPIEALKYNTPSVVSNVTSIPEILGDAGIYFSPFYPADLYRALKLALNNTDYNKKRMEERLLFIQKKQKEDLTSLIKEILNK